MTEQSTNTLLSRFDDQDQTQADLTARLEAMHISQQKLAEQLYVLKSEVSDIDHTLKTVSAHQRTKATQQKSAAPATKAVRVDKASVTDKVVLGRLEWLWLEKAENFFKTQIDTGSLSSVLYVRKSVEFERDGDKWMRFDLMVEHNDQELLQTLEAPIVKRVKTKSTSKDTEMRARVSLLVRIGDVVEEQEFSLVEKKSPSYPIILGRSFLTDIAVVDVAKKFIHKRAPDLEQKAKDRYDPLVVKTDSSVAQKKP